MTDEVDYMIFGGVMGFLIGILFTIWFARWWFL